MGVPLVDLSWVDSKVVRISSSYKTEAFVSKFLDKCPVLKAGEHSSFFSVVPCSSTESVCLGRSGIGPPFFYMYTCLFADLHVSLPFDKFIMDVLRALYVASTQIHPNTWASIQAFRLLCDVMRLHPSPFSFLSYYTSHPAQPVSWHSLIGQSGSVLFNSFVVSYKIFKESFVKVIVRPEATTYFFDEAGWSQFPLYWTSQPRDFKEWPRPMGGADELEILSLFDALPRKLPTRRLIVHMPNWRDGRPLRVCVFISAIGRFCLLSSNTCNFFAEIMAQKSPAGPNILDAYKGGREKKASQHRCLRHNKRLERPR